LSGLAAPRWDRREKQKKKDIARESAASGLTIQSCVSHVQIIFKTGHKNLRETLLQLGS